MRVVDTVGVLVLLLGLPLVAVVVRRQRLLHRPGAVECALRLRPRGGGGWSLGVLRYSGSQLLWWRVLSLSPRPVVVLDRGALTVLCRREAVRAEHIAVTAGGEVLDCSLAGVERVEIAMTPTAATGLGAWLEAAPPGSTSPEPRRAPGSARL